MNIISYNVNGLRAFADKGALDNIIDSYQPDILCMQETKAPESIVASYSTKWDYKYVPFSNSSRYKKGYAGVSTWISEDKLGLLKGVYTPKIMDGYGDGRLVILDLTDYFLVNVYTLNSGNKDDLRIQWNSLFTNLIKSLLTNNPVVIVGDLNIVASELDYWSNYEDAIDTYPGLMRFEIDHFYDMKSECKLVDSFRQLHPYDRRYSWYSYQGQARERNRGWRIDYGLVSESLMNRVKDSLVLSEVTGSDHSPIQLIIE